MNKITKEVFICPYCGEEARMFGRKDLNQYLCDSCQRLIGDLNIIKKEERL